MCEGVEFRVCLRVESLDFRVEGCQFAVFGLRVWFVVKSAAFRGISFAFEDWGVSGLGLRA